MAEEKIKKVEVAVIGPAKTGKTQLISQFRYGTFEPTYQATLGVDFVSRKYGEEKPVIEARLRDSAGQERFRSFLPGYIEVSDAIAIVLATTDLEGNPITQAALKTDAEKFYQTAKEHVNVKKGEGEGEPEFIPPIYFVINEFVDAKGSPLGKEPPLSRGEITNTLEDVADIPVSFCCARNGKGVEETFNKILGDAYCYKQGAKTIPACFLPSASVPPPTVPTPTDLTGKQPGVPSSESPFSVEKFLKFLADHKKLLIGDGILIAAAIIILATLASLPIGGLPVLAGLSALAVAGITAGVVLLAWTLGGIIGNVLFKENDGEALLRPDKGLPRKPSPSASHDQKQTPGGKHYPSVISTSSEKTSEEELKPLPDSEEASKQQPGSSSGTPKNQ